MAECRCAACGSANVQVRSYNENVGMENGLMYRPMGAYAVKTVTYYYCLECGQMLYYPMEDAAFEKVEEALAHKCDPAKEGFLRILKRKYMNIEWDIPAVDRRVLEPGKNWFLDDENLPPNSPNDYPKDQLKAILKEDISQRAIPYEVTEIEAKYGRFFWTKVVMKELCNEGIIHYSDVNEKKYIEVAKNVEEIEDWAYKAEANNFDESKYLDEFRQIISDNQNDWKDEIFRKFTRRYDELQNTKNPYMLQELEKKLFRHLEADGEIICDGETCRTTTSAEKELAVRKLIMENLATYNRSYNEVLQYENWKIKCMNSIMGLISQRPYLRNYFPSVYAFVQALMTELAGYNLDFYTIYALCRRLENDGKVKRFEAERGVAFANAPNCMYYVEIPTMTEFTDMVSNPECHNVDLSKDLKIVLLNNHVEKEFTLSQIMENELDEIKKKHAIAPDSRWYYDILREMMYFEQRSAAASEKKEEEYTWTFVDENKARREELHVMIHDLGEQIIALKQKLEGDKEALKKIEKEVDERVFSCPDIEWHIKYNENTIRDLRNAMPMLSPEQAQESENKVQDLLLENERWNMQLQNKRIEFNTQNSNDCKKYYENVKATEREIELREQQLEDAKKELDSL